MNNNNSFKYASVKEIQKRTNLVREFLTRIVSTDEYPLYVSDDATIFDISSDSEVLLQLKINDAYEVNILKEHLSLKLWQLIDLIYENTH